MYLKEHGLKVTMLEYYSYDFGPVPNELYLQIREDKLPEYLKMRLYFQKSKEMTNLKIQNIILE